MKAKMKAKISVIDRTKEYVEIGLTFQGAVQDATKSTGKEAIMHSTLKLRPVIADELKLGSVLNIILTDEELTD